MCYTSLSSLLRKTWLAALALVAFGCSSDDSWEPGPAAKADAQQVRFVDDGNSTHIIMPGFDVSNQVIQVRRSSSAGSLVVPIEVLTASDALIIPESVTFADGETETTMEVALKEGITEGVHKYIIHLASDEVDPYTQLDGISYYRGTVSFAIPHRAQLWISGYADRVGTWAEDFLEMGDGDYLLPDFCHSGYAIRIHVDGQNYATVHAYRATLTTYTYDYGNFVYLYDKSAGGFITCYPHGEDSWVRITEITFFNGTGDYRGYGRYYPSTKQFALCLGRLRTLYDEMEENYQMMYIKIMPDGVEPEVVEPANPEGK